MSYEDRLSWTRRRDRLFGAGPPDRGGRGLSSGWVPDGVTTACVCVFVVKCVGPENGHDHNIRYYSSRVPINVHTAAAYPESLASDGPFAHILDW